MKMNEKIRNMTIGLFCAATVSILLTGCVSGEATKQSAAAFRYDYRKSQGRRRDCQLGNAGYLGKLGRHLERP